jgi:IS5 family transposase
MPARFGHPRELTRPVAFKGLFERFDAALRVANYIVLSGQIRAQAAQCRQREGGDQGGPYTRGLKALPGKLRRRDRDAAGRSTP